MCSPEAVASYAVGAVELAVTDGAVISWLGVAFVAKKLGVEPGEVTRYDRATDGER